jgi:hypothetical protein
VERVDDLALELHLPRVGDDLLSIPADAVEHGEVFTRRWVVELILDLAGYTPDQDLAALRAVEPACGTGAFLGPMVDRLSVSLRKHGRSLADGANALRAFDLLSGHVATSRRVAVDILLSDGWEHADIDAVVPRWVEQGDYLLRGQDSDIDFVVGNPPYIRLEDVPPDRQAAYRRVCQTMGGRADVYVGFFERGLRSLTPDGVLAFICADRWMRNQYGRHLRQLIATGFSVDVTITMHDVDAFEEQVSAYPAISLLRRGAQGRAVVANTTRRFNPEDADRVKAWIAKDRAQPARMKSYEIGSLPHWFAGGESWPAGSPARLASIEALNDRFPPLEDPATGTRVGIGVATGADAVFVTTDRTVVEPDRLLPLSMVRDTASGSIAWSGHFLVDPWEPDGRLVDLSAYPRLNAYFERNAETLTKRNVAGRRPAQWYRTIDKVDHSLTARPKLLFPDMKMTSEPVLEEGGLYPHHNLYFVVSEEWDLSVLGGLLLSKVAEAFIDAYAVKMRGGTLRFQAQYLRRIRVPDPATISDVDRAALREAFNLRDVAAATEVAERLYGIRVGG